MTCEGERGLYLGPRKGRGRRSHETFPWSVLQPADASTPTAGPAIRRARWFLTLPSQEYWDCWVGNPSRFDLESSSYTHVRLTHEADQNISGRDLYDHHQLEGSNSAPSRSTLSPWVAQGHARQHLAERRRSRADHTSPDHSRANRPIARLTQMRKRCPGCLAKRTHERS